MLDIHIDNLLMLDIETVSQYPGYQSMPEKWQHLWDHKVAMYLPEGDTAESFYPKRAAILAEFGKIVCISMGYFNNEGSRIQLRIKSFYGDDEKQLLQTFIQAVNKWQTVKRHMSFCGHNVKEFDLPYICRRLLVNSIGIPSYLNFQSMKPWETNIVDTMQFWKFGDFKNYISLNLLAACLGVESPKDDIDGSMVGAVYWEEQNLPRIMHYCQKDVVTVGQVVLKMKNLPLLEEAQVELVP
ncbi:MAG: ribonuclease H-like domain-containing protein [Chitinophagaceae bacterium]